MDQFITDLFLLSSKDSDSSSIVLDTTANGGDGNLFESSWRHKGKRLIGMKRNVDDEYVVTDVAVVCDDQDVPDDFAGVLITKDNSERGLKKHILCYSRDSRKTSPHGVTEIVLVNKDELIPAYFTAVGEKVNDIKICYKTEPMPKPPKPLPRAPARPLVTEQRQQRLNNPHKSPVSGIDGVPFQINPKYNAACAASDPIINSISVVSIDEITAKYQYSFVMERETMNG